MPMFSDAPVEMGMSEATDDDPRRACRATPTISGCSTRPFPVDADPFTINNVIYAITSFERT